jgi:hypothetical protein
MSRLTCHLSGVTYVVDSDIGWRGRTRTFNPLIQSQVPSEALQDLGLLSFELGSRQDARVS